MTIQLKGFKLYLRLLHALLILIYLIFKVITCTFDFNSLNTHNFQNFKLYFKKKNYKFIILKNLQNYIL